MKAKQEKRKMSFKRKTITQLIVIAVLSIVLLVLLLLRNNQKVCEFFATTFSRAWIFLFGNLFGWLPFSLYELFLVVAIVGLITVLVLLIVHLAKRRFKKVLSLVLTVAIVALTFVNVYSATASFAYNREPLPEEIYTEFDSEDFTFEEAESLARRMVERVNYAYNNTVHDEKGNIVYPYSFRELSNKLAEEYKRLDNDYLSSYTPRGKRILNKWIMSQMHITGVFFAPFGEANVNGNENTLYLPFTLAHEMAHGKGVMKEYQADIVALYVTATASDPYLYYGSCVKLAFTALQLLRLYPNSQEVYKTLYNSVEEGIFTERRNYSEFYAQFTLLDDVGEFFNDIYLKLQKQEGGTESYVKPGETQGTGVKDDFQQEIVQIIHFSGTQNLLILLSKQGKL